MSLWVILISLSGIASLVAWIGLVNAAFRNGEKNWGIILVVSIFVPLLGPVAAFVFLFKHWNIARIPGLILCASFALLVIGTVGMMLGFKRMAREMVENPEFVAAMRESGMIANPTGAAVDPEPPPASPSAPETPPTPATAPTPPVATRPTVARTRPEPPPRPSTTPPVAGPSPAQAETAVRDIRESPLTIDSVRVGEPNPNQMRELRARARNTADQAVREARLSLEYFDARGLRLGRWTTVHSEPTPFVAARATNEFSLQAFFVPQFTKSVRVDVEFVRFADGGRWPPLDPSLVPASAREATP